MNFTQLPLGCADESAATLAIDDLPLPYVEIDARGIITRVNRAALSLHPPEQGNPVGQFAFSLLAGGDRETSFQSFSAFLESREGEPLAVTRYIYDRTGKYSACQLYRSVIRDASGNPAGMRVVFVNIAEMTLALEETRRRNQWLESVVDSLHEAIIATDAMGVITGVNAAAEELLGWKQAELVGKLFEEGIQVRSFQASDRSNVTFAMVLASRCNGLSTFVDRHGREVAVRVWSSPVIDKDTGSVNGIVLLMYKPGAPFIVPG